MLKRLISFFIILVERGDVFLLFKKKVVEKLGAGPPVEQQRHAVRPHAAVLPRAVVVGAGRGGGSRVTSFVYLHVV